MFPAQRKQRILQLLSTRGALGSTELADILDVSYETVRRDLSALEADHSVVRSHGGVQLADARGVEASYLDRAGHAIEGKAAIGRAAARLIEPGMTVLIDVGTTALEVARALDEGYHGTVVTCSIPVAIELSGRPGVEVMVNAGRVRPGDLSISGASAVDYYRDIFTDLAFLGSGGVDATAGLTDYHLDEVLARRAILRNADRAFVLADATKFGRVAAHRVCDLDQVAGLITDQDPPAEITAAFGRAGGQVVVAN